MNRFERLLLGIAADPFVVACTRAVVFFLLPIGVEALVTWVNHWPAGVLASLAPLTVALIRAIEGAMDKALKPGQNQER